MQKTKGVLTACDKNQEWILPWWWHHYHKNNSYEVTFVDLGMTKEAIKWCQTKGHLIPLKKEKNFVKDKENISPKLVKLWTNHQKKLSWSHREKLFLKPLALMQTPYQKTIWLDCDCEVKCPLDPLFLLTKNPSKLSVAIDASIAWKAKKKWTSKKEVPINSGVIVYEKSSSVIQKFAEKAKTDNAEFFTDQELLSRILYEEKSSFSLLDTKYNYAMPWSKIDYPSCIDHWTLQFGKIHIYQQIQLLLIYSKMGLISFDTFYEDIHEKWKSFTDFIQKKSLG
jgi:hypothetical protein